MFQCIYQLREAYVAMRAITGSNKASPQPLIRKDKDKFDSILSKTSFDNSDYEFIFSDLATDEIKQFESEYSSLCEEAKVAFSFLSMINYGNFSASSTVNKFSNIVEATKYINEFCKQNKYKEAIDLMKKYQLFAGGEIATYEEYTEEKYKELQQKQLQTSSPRGDKDFPCIPTSNGSWRSFRLIEDMSKATSVTKACYALWYLTYAEVHGMLQTKLMSGKVEGTGHAGLSHYANAWKNGVKFSKLNKDSDVWGKPFEMVEILNFK